MCLEGNSLFLLGVQVPDQRVPFVDQYDQFIQQQLLSSLLGLRLLPVCNSNNNRQPAPSDQKTLETTRLYSEKLDFWMEAFILRRSEEHQPCSSGVPLHWRHPPYGLCVCVCVHTVCKHSASGCVLTLANTLEGRRHVNLQPHDARGDTWRVTLPQESAAHTTLHYEPRNTHTLAYSSI